MKFKQAFTAGVISLGLLTTTGVSANALGTVSVPARVSTPVSTPAPRVSTPSTNVSKPSVSTSSSRATTSSSTTKSTNTAPKPTTTPKYTGKISSSKSGTGRYFKPTPKPTTTGYNSSKKESLKDRFKQYQNKPYFNSTSGFATGLLTSTGAYLLLDSINDNDEPVYVDSETGKKINPDELDKMNVKVADDEKEDEMSTGDIILWTILGIMIGGFIVAVIMMLTL